MAAEALVHNGHATDVHGWIDKYADRLEEAPRGIARATAAYSPAEPQPAGTGDPGPAEVMDQAALSGDPHAIKFADAAVESWRWRPDQDLLTAAVTATATMSDG